MKFAALLSLAAALRVIIAQNVNTTELPEYCDIEGLSYNDTNVAALNACLPYNYICITSNNSDEFAISTPSTAPPSCSPFEWLIFVGLLYNGPLTIPVVSTSQVVIEGRSPWENTTYPALNVTDLEMPDLVNVSGNFEIRYTDNMQSLALPALSTVAQNLVIDLSGKTLSGKNLSATSPPAINLSFPSLKSVRDGVNLTGNIDAVDLPVLTEANSINVISTGNLDCEAFVKKVVNATPASNYTLDSVICNSKLANITTHNPLPAATHKNTGSLGMRRDEVLWFGLLGCFLLLL